MVGPRSLLVLAALSVSVGTAADVVYVNELSIFSVLAPCAQAAVSGVINYETYSHCPSGASGLQSCICTKNNGGNLATVSSSISSSLDYTCGLTATDDQASAATVLAGYCNQDKITPFAQPSHTVSQYIVDLSAYHNLAPCAQSAVGSAVLDLTWSLCQEDASLLATCACKKNKNSLYASSMIDSSIKTDCYGHTADASSAQAVFAGYCGLVDGTTSFPETTDPPGHMNYYITALEEFKSLASCAQTAVSVNVLQQTLELCPSGPKALASCACLRSEMTGSISSSITSDARYYCSSNADDIASALAVWDLYCSAAKGLTVPAGVTETVSQASSTSSPQTRSKGAQETGKVGASGNDTSPDGPVTTMSNTGVIAGAVAGSVLGTALIALAAFLLYRRSKKAQAKASTTAAADDDAKPELDSTPIVPRTSGSPSPSMMKDRMENASPISAMSGSPYAPPPMPELHNQPPRTPELHGQGAPSPRTPNEAYGREIHEANSYPMSELQGMGWQSGPVPHAYEMDASNGRG
ncbi:hypothetical protein F5Y14DRAFT_407178 [Nemania sp. NC0429]|nr:hypothetical protein F5Y14DRAFT_407178 [Nemania sp. NC0429]